MQVIINEVLSTVRAVDGDTVLSEKSMRVILQTVLQAIEVKQDHGQRVAEEQSLESYQRRPASGR